MSRTNGQSVLSPLVQFYNPYPGWWTEKADPIISVVSDTCVCPIGCPCEKAVALSTLCHRVGSCCLVLDVPYLSWRPEGRALCAVARQLSWDISVRPNRLGLQGTMSISPGGCPFITRINSGPKRSHRVGENRSIQCSQYNDSTHPHNESICGISVNSPSQPEWQNLSAESPPWWIIQKGGKKPWQVIHQTKSYYLFIQYFLQYRAQRIDTFVFQHFHKGCPIDQPIQNDTGWPHGY